MITEREEAISPSLRDLIDLRRKTYAQIKRIFLDSGTEAGIVNVGYIREHVRYIDEAVRLGVTVSLDLELTWRSALSGAEQAWREFML